MTSSSKYTLPVGSNVFHGRVDAWCFCISKCQPPVNSGDKGCCLRVSAGCEYRMSEHELCMLINATVDQLEDEGLSNLAFVFIPCIISVLAQIAVLILARYQPFIARLHTVFVATIWILVAALVEANRRFGFFLKPRNELESWLMCKGIGFGQVATQLLAVCGALLSSIAVLKLWKPNDEEADEENKCRRYTLFGVVWLVSIVAGIVAALIHQPECLIFRDINGTRADEMTTFCTLQSDLTRITYTYARLVLFVIIPLFLFIFRLLALYIKRRRSQTHRHCTYEVLDFDCTVRKMESVPTSLFKRHQAAAKEKERRKAFRFLMPMALIFSICWAPIHILKLMQAIQASWFQHHMETDALVGLTNGTAGEIEWNDGEMDKDLAVLYDRLEPYFFSLWILYPAFIACLQFAASRKARKLFSRMF